MNEVLVRAVVEALAFAELTDEELLDLRAAVTHEEVMAWVLQKLTGSERAEFCALVLKIADEEERGSGSNRRTEFIRTIPEALGLVE